jgi:hypothetical protein
MSIYRLRTTWSGAPVVGEGLSTFFLNAAPSTFHASVGNFFNAIKALFPAGITWTTPNTGDVLDEGSGALTGTWTESGGASTVVSTGTANFANGVGMRVIWPTAGIFHGRRVVGSTFLVPLLNGLYTSDGTIDNTAVTTVDTAALALLAAEGDLSIWSRPSGGGPGQANPVTSAQAVDRVSWLRSRRT